VDFASIIGIVFAVGAILGGFSLEGGHVASILQPTAAIIVFGGTCGAAMLQFPGSQLKKAVLGVRDVFLAPKSDLGELIATLVKFAEKARREGIVALEADAEQVSDPFLAKALGLAVDGSESRVVRESMEVELTAAEERGEGASKVFEAAGGYSPTVGILGAVLGLIHVMENLADPAKLGAGIAVAFVATVYGVGLANLVLLPISGKLRARHREVIVRYELMVAGIAAIVDGENPRLIEQKLSGYHKAEAGKAEAKVAAVRRAA
jgi:chemotaxis protein MotA